MNLIPRARRQSCSACGPSTSSPAPQSEAMLVVDVDLIEPLGADTLVYGHIGDGDGARVAARLPADVDGGRRASSRCATTPQNAHWFDPASGKRIEA